MPRPHRQHSIPARKQPTAPASALRGYAPNRLQVTLALLLVFAAVTLTYSNHFHNGFHFDDTYAILLNPYLRDLHNVPLFFKDVHTGNAHAHSQTYRPLLTTFFAVDYWLGHGLEPLWFHVTAFAGFLAQLALMYLLFRRIFDAARPDPRNAWVALFATALYGLHPAMAETVNYIWQSGDLYSALAVIAGLAAYVGAPGLRRYGLYLLPVIAGLLIKQPTAVFPVLLFAWVWLFEEERFFKAAVRCIPAFLVIGALAYLSLRLSAATAAGFGSPYAFHISQPAVLLSYFRRFFVPLDLSADTDRKPYESLLEVDVILGFLFMGLVAAAVLWSRRRRATRPIAFGLVWYIVASVPTSWFAIGEVENDHRMYFPFVGLAMALCWAAALWVYARPVPRVAVLGACAFLLALAAWGTRQRNIVWHTEESLWLDVTRKSPKNGRGLMNYGLTQMTQGKYTVALDYFTRALQYAPDYPFLETNLGIVNASLHRDAEAEAHFLRAIRLAPTDSELPMYYARWLVAVSRVPEAIANLKHAIVLKPDNLECRQMLMGITARSGDAWELRAQAAATLALFPSDSVASGYLATTPAPPPNPPKPAVSADAAADRPQTTAESCLLRSLQLYRAQKYPESIAAAREALAIRPDYAEAWNNLMVAYNMVSDWDNAIAAGEKATQLAPSMALYRNNLAWARAEKAKASAPHP